MLWWWWGPAERCSGVWTLDFGLVGRRRRRRLRHYLCIQFNNAQSSFLTPQTLFHSALFSHCPSILIVAFLSTSHFRFYCSPFNPCVQITSTHTVNITFTLLLPTLLCAFHYFTLILSYSNSSSYTLVQILPLTQFLLRICHYSCIIHKQ